MARPKSCPFAHLRKGRVYRELCCWAPSHIYVKVEFSTSREIVPLRTATSQTELFIKLALLLFRRSTAGKHRRRVGSNCSRRTARLFLLLLVIATAVGFAIPHQEHAACGVDELLSAWTRCVGAGVEVEDGD